MRPVPDLPPFSRKSTFDPPLQPDPTPENHGDHKESMYGVQSLGETLSRSELPASDQPDLAPSKSLQEDDLEESKNAPRRSTLKPFDSATRDSSMRPSLTGAASRPLNSLHPDEPSSLPSSPISISNQSLRPLDDISITDEIGSQMIESDEEDRPGFSPRLGPHAASQLIMPSIKMPSRRPFTEKGKAMGRFKILLAGAPGSGKTSLIKSIVQTCEDIVHVDSLPSVDSSLERRRSSRPHSGSVPTRGAAMTEIYASTKPYPSWWSDLEDSRVLRRRKSIGEIVLERNLCFVDQPATSLSRAGQTDAVLQYMRQQLQRAITALAVPGIDFQNLLAGNGGSQVDAILYLISHDTLTTDVQCICKLSELSNVIPVIAKADTLSSEEVTSLKTKFHEQAQNAGIKPFMFGDLLLGGLDGLEPQPPYTVSSEKTIDMEIMDASTLMSPDYVQPLSTSELDILVRKLFNRDNLAWMRHSAAKKLMQRRSEFPPIPPTTTPLRNALSGTTAGWRAISSSSMDTSISFGESAPSYAMARISDYTKHEENMAQVRLAHWATDLQRSLQNERDRYASLAQGDRAIWLTERLSECVVDGSLVPISKTPGFCGLQIPTHEKGSGALHALKTHPGLPSTYRVASLSTHDPLGVVGWIDDLGRHGWAIMQVVGGVGVVGGLAFWLARTWGLPSRTLSELQVEYWFGSLDR
ncbi:uncharacterized protein N7484_008797 [Penicillium longicatenatum]|uniref:uncharacterized protein n=1 Tax=Penicillium longicatenatum TaxID=1561947 RepID=UPI002547281F|nr:uncharacterized protein N7484_008797 [Penicillium longicatenatum]KAJ5635484.1 hypothetical protein N7484_008797 [Penicillium longicatenatum]